MSRADVAATEKKSNLFLRCGYFPDQGGGRKSLKWAAMRLSNLFAGYTPRPNPTPRHTAAVQPEIAAADPADVDAIARITFEREGGTYDAARQRAARWLAADEQQNLMLVARTGGKIAGYARAGFIPGRSDEEYDVPRGWYLGGLVVAEAFRRRGIGSALTARRIDRLAERGAQEIFYFVNSLNRASIDLHVPFGFVEVRRDFRFPGVTFSNGGTGILFRAPCGGSGAVS